MSLDEHVLRDVEAARTRLEVLEDEAYEARAAFHSAIRRLHATGGSMREIATALGMSHQRVHQIIGTEGIVEVEPSAVTEVSSFPVGPTSGPSATSAVSPSSRASSSTAVTPTGVDDACSFCGAPRRELDKLLAGPGPVFICGGCVQLATALVGGKGTTPTIRRGDVDEDATCEVCGYGSANGGVMGEAAAGQPRICANCMGVCERIVQERKPGRPMVRRNTRIRCSFCNISANDTRQLVAGPGVYICDGCIGAARAVVDSAQPAKGPRSVLLRPAVAEDHECAFCSKSPQHVDSMVKGGRGRICGECLQLCEDIIQEAS
jgi:hypothetical protein